MSFETACVALERDSWGDCVGEVAQEELPPRIEQASSPPAEDSLPWSALALTGTDIPWSDLDTLAAAAAQSDQVRRRLCAALRAHVDRQAKDDPDVGSTFEDLAIPAVFALAADRMDAAGRSDVARLLVQLLYEAGEMDSDFLLDTCQYFCRFFAPETAAPAIDLIRSRGHDLECEFHLASVLQHAGQADHATRDEVLRLCRGIVQTAPDRDRRFSSAEPFAMVLGELGDTKSLPLLRSILKRSRSPEIRGAIDRLEGRDDPSESTPGWEAPLREWLPKRLEWARGAPDEEDRSGTEPEDISAEDPYRSALDGFFASDAYAELTEPTKGRCLFAVEAFLRYSREYVGVALADMSRVDVEEVLLCLFPRKITSEDEFFDHATSGIAAFIRWMGQNEGLLSASVLAEWIEGCAEELSSRARDPHYWGLAKTAAMLGLRAGLDISTQEGMDEAMRLYNETVSGISAEQEDDGEEEWADDPYVTPPIHRQRERIPRNSPCPCGSGRKYKKCCGGLK